MKYNPLHPPPPHNPPLYTHKHIILVYICTHFWQSSLDHNTITVSICTFRILAIDLTNVYLSPLNHLIFHSEIHQLFTSKINQQKEIKAAERITDRDTNISSISVQDLKSACKALSDTRFSMNMENLYYMDRIRVDCSVTLYCLADWLVDCGYGWNG